MVRHHPCASILRLPVRIPYSHHRKGVCMNKSVHSSCGIGMLWAVACNRPVYQCKCKQCDASQCGSRFWSKVGDWSCDQHSAIWLGCPGQHVRTTSIHAHFRSDSLSDSLSMVWSLGRNLTSTQHKQGSTILALVWPWIWLETTSLSLRSHLLLLKSYLHLLSLEVQINPSSKSPIVHLATLE